MLADIAEQPSLPEDRLRVVLNLQRAQSGQAGEHVRGAAIEPGHEDSRSTPETRECAAPGASRASRSARLVSTPRQSEADDTVNPLVGARDERRRLDGQEPLDVTCHQQRLFEARGDVRIEPACLGMRGDGLS